MKTNKSNVETPKCKGADTTTTWTVTNVIVPIMNTQISIILWIIGDTTTEHGHHSSKNTEELCKTTADSDRTTKTTLAKEIFPHTPTSPFIHQQFI
jgi:hypothetical protein